MLPFRSGRIRELGVTGFLLTLSFAGYSAFGQGTKAKKEKAKMSSALTNIPLPVGQEAKGLVLPDFDAEGHLRARFEAGTAKRTDVEHLDFTSLKMTTFNEQNAIDLQIEVPVSRLDLTSRVLSSSERTTVTRTDFNIAGDRMQFDTVSRQGTLTGNVKMVITDQSDLRKTPAE